VELLSRAVNFRRELQDINLHAVEDVPAVVPTNTVDLAATVCGSGQDNRYLPDLEMARVVLVVVVNFISAIFSSGNETNAQKAEKPQGI
jgi:hypothetical protein